MSTGTITRIGVRPARRSTAAGSAVHSPDIVASWPPAASVLVLAVANTAIAASLVVLTLTLFR